MVHPDERAVGSEFLRGDREVNRLEQCVPGRRRRRTLNIPVVAEGKEADFLHTCHSARLGADIPSRLQMPASPVAGAAPGLDSGTMANELVVLETEGWHALSIGPAEATAYYSRVLAREPVIMLTNGLRITDRNQIVASMDGPPWSAFEIIEPQETYLGSDVGFLTYKVRADRDGTPYTALLSSVYAKEDGEWKLALHQHTPY